MWKPGFSAIRDRFKRKEIRFFGGKIFSLTPPPHSTGRRSRYAHDDLGFSLKLFQIAPEAYTATRFGDLTLPVRFYYASVTLLLPSHYYNKDLATLTLRWWRCSCDLATTLAMELRFRSAFISFLYRI